MSAAPDCGCCASSPVLLILIWLVLHWTTGATLGYYWHRCGWSTGLWVQRQSMGAAPGYWCSTEFSACCCIGATLGYWCTSIRSEVNVNEHQLLKWLINCCGCICVVQTMNTTQPVTSPMATTSQPPQPAAVTNQYVFNAPVYQLQIGDSNMMQPSTESPASLPPPLVGPSCHWYNISHCPILVSKYRLDCTAQCMEVSDGPISRPQKDT